MGVHSFKYSGIANKKTVDLQVTQASTGKKDSKVVMTKKVRESGLF